MDNKGQFGAYSINRPLREQEIKDHLDPRVPLKGIEASDDNKVIQMNSTFIEIVDKYWETKGTVTFFSLIAVALFSVMTFGFPIMALIRGDFFGEGLPYFLLIILIGVGAIGLMVFLITRESFSYTHYPIRFNRKHRLVHMVRQNGTALTVPWEEVFFTMGSPRGNYWEIQGLVLDQDRKTVKEVIPLPLLGVGTHEKELIKGFWEFVRRYMEDPDPKWCYEKAEFLLPIANRKADFKMMLKHVREHTAFLGVIMQTVFSLPLILTWPGRWFAIRTSKLPEWPQEVIDLCKVEPNDPYAKDASQNPALSRSERGLLPPVWMEPPAKR